MADTESKLATFNLVVDYEELPSDEDVERVVEVAREYGRIVKAELVILKEARKDFR